MDIKQIYNIVRNRDKKINSYFKKLPKDLEEMFTDILTALNLEVNEENLLALKKRFFHLREDSLINILSHLDKKELQETQIEIYELVKIFWLKEHEKLIEELKPHLTPFYSTLIEGVHKIGVAFSNWQVSWTKHIIFDINENLSLEFNGDEAKILNYLIEADLMEKDNGIIADRSYSVLVKYNDKYKLKTYYQAFTNEIENIVKEIDSLILNLENLYDDNKKEWILYFNSIKNALLETNKSELINKWREVDRLWMDINSPIQVAHPLEYYEDKYRKAVALEFDVRVLNPDIKSNVKDSIINMYKKYCNDEKILNNGLNNINKTQLYISSPMLFYAAEFNGLFSAQVVPNDEIVSLEKGKKIFAFVDKVYEDILSRPKMLLAYEIFTKEFMENFYKNLTKEKFIKIYDITTIGHEFGHILFIDSDTENLMNRSGMFKNLEEFKATLGGLIAFFENEDKSLIDDILIDIIKRAVGLISWMEIDEVLPYYIEGLIHLEILFKSEVIKFNSNHLEYNFSNYNKLKELYINTYKEIANLYINKEDSKKFLDKYIYKDKNSYYPKNNIVDEFVRYYYKRYKEIGNKLYKEEK